MLPSPTQAPAAGPQSAKAAQSEPRASLTMDVRVGESVAIDGQRIVITVESKSGQLARLRFDHDKTADVQRLPSIQGAASAAARGVSWPARA